MGTAEVVLALLALLADGVVTVEDVVVALLVLGAERAPLAPVVGMKRTIVIDSCSSCCGAGAWKVSSVGFEHEGMPVALSPPQQAQREDASL